MEWAISPKTGGVIKVGGTAWKALTASQKKSAKKTSNPKVPTKGKTEKPKSKLAKVTRPVKMSHHWKTVTLFFKDGEYQDFGEGYWPSDTSLREAFISSFKEEISPELQKKIKLNFKWLKDAPIEDVIDAVMNFGEMVYGYKHGSGTAWISITKIPGPIPTEYSPPRRPSNLDSMAPSWTKY